MKNSKEENKEKDSSFEIEIELINGFHEMHMKVTVENKNMLISELMDKCVENEQNQRNGDIFNLQKCVYFEFKYEDEQLLPFKTIDYYDIEQNSKLQLIINEYEEQDGDENDDNKRYYFSNFERDKNQQIFFTKQKEYKNSNMKIKEGLNILCQCRNNQCIEHTNKIMKKNTHIFKEKTNSNFEFKFYSPKHEVKNSSSPSQSPSKEKKNSNQGMFIFNLKSVKFNFILDKKKLKCPRCRHVSELIGCILYNKGCVFKGVQVKQNEKFSKEIEITEFSNKSFCAKYIDIFNNFDNNNQQDTYWSKLTVDIKDIDNCVNYENYLINTYSSFQKEIALLFNDFPIKRHIDSERWYKTEQDNNIFLIGKSKHKERGIFKFNNSNIKFIGYLKNGEMNNYGYLIDNQNITFYKGTFKNGMKHGKGKLWLNENELYEGEFKKDKPHGNGFITYANGNKWEGTFRNGLRDGMGVFTRGKDGKRILSFYRNDKLEWNFTEVIEKKMKWDGTKSFKKEFQNNNNNDNY